MIFVWYYSQRQFNFNPVSISIHKNHILISSLFVSMLKKKMIVEWGTATPHDWLANKNSKECS